MTTTVHTTLKISSPAFENNSYIPSKFSCEGENVNPEIYIGNLPEDTQSIALIMDDPDAPNGTYDHWLMWNIPPIEKIEENSAPGVQGVNSAFKQKYIGPCPPSGVHHYHFKVFALDSHINLPRGTNKDALIRAMEGHIRAYGKLIGLYKR